VPNSEVATWGKVGGREDSFIRTEADLRFPLACVGQSPESSVKKRRKKVAKGGKGEKRGIPFWKGKEGKLKAGCKIRSIPGVVRRRETTRRKRPPRNENGRQRPNNGKKKKKTPSGRAIKRNVKKEHLWGKKSCQMGRNTLNL